MGPMEQHHVESKFFQHLAVPPYHFRGGEDAVGRPEPPGHGSLDHYSPAVQIETAVTVLFSNVEEAKSKPLTIRIRHPSISGGERRHGLIQSGLVGSPSLVALQFPQLRVRHRSRKCEGSGSGRDDSSLRLPPHSHARISLFAQDKRQAPRCVLDEAFSNVKNT